MKKRKRTTSAQSRSGEHLFNRNYTCASVTFSAKLARKRSIPLTFPKRCGFQNCRRCVLFPSALQRCRLAPQILKKKKKNMKKSVRRALLLLLGRQAESAADFKKREKCEGGLSINSNRKGLRDVRPTCKRERECVRVCKRVCVSEVVSSVSLRGKWPPTH